MRCEWGDLISLEYGKPVSDKDSVNGKYPVFGTNGQIGTSNLPPLCPHSSFVIGRKGAYRGVHYSDVPFSVIDTAFYVESKKPDILDIKWAYYKFLTYDINHMDSGSAIPSTDRYEIYSIDVDLPSIDVQKKIATILSALDEKIATNRAINDNLYHLLSLSFKNDYWDKAIDHPEWIMTTLDETTSRFGTGLNPRKNFVLGHGNNYYVTIKNMGNNRIYLDERCDKIDDEAIRKIQMRSDLKVGDLLFSGIGTIGRVFLIDKPATNWNTSESVFNLRPNAKVSSEFLYLLLLNNDMQDYAISLASGSVQKGIRMADLKKYSFFLPTSDVIKRLTSLWKPLIKQIKANEVESDSLAVLRDTLLPKLMSGEIDVSSVLL